MLAPPLDPLASTPNKKGRRKGPRAEPAGFFALRTPLLPFDTLENWAIDLQAPHALHNAEGLDQAVAHDRALLRERLRQIVERPDVREALFLGSPDLEAAIPLWEREHDSDRGRRLERALVRYLTRMAGRPTPFGLFAGCSVGRMGRRTRLVVAGAEHYRRHSRISVDYLTAVADAVAHTDEARSTIRFRPNPTLYRGAETVRCIVQRGDRADPTYRLIAVPDTPTLARVLKTAEDGAALPTLAAELVAGGASADDAERYLARLVGQQILLADLGPRVTGPEPLAPLVADLREIAGADGVADHLERAGQMLEALDQGGLGHDTSRYRDLAEQLKPDGLPVDPSRTLQVDLVKPAPEATLGPVVAAELARAAEVLHRLAPPNPWRELDRFRDAFYERYGEREVPLVEALDRDLGIGFGPMTTTAPVLEGLRLLREPKPDPTEWTRREQFMLPRVVEALRSGDDEIALSASDIDEMAERDGASGPSAFAIQASVAAESQEQLDRGRFQVIVRSLSAPSGALMLARFAHADPELKEGIQKLLAAEEALDPNAIFAEVAHLPPGALGNAVVRPALREYEIPYLGRSGITPDRQIAVGDLLVSVAAGQVILRSARLGRRVIPRITNAHAYLRSSLPLYRILGSLQPEVPVLSWWDWGRLANLPFLPRLTFGRLVLSPARWRLASVDLARLREIRQGSDRDLFAGVQQWRATRGMPRWVAVGDCGEGLPVDLDNLLSIEMLVHLLGDRSAAALEEVLPKPEELSAYGPEGRVAHEIVVPLLDPQASTKSPPAPFRSSGPAEGVRRTFPPGSEWLQAELYGPPSAADRVLVEFVHPMVRRALASGAVDTWFFIRYFSPGPHLRVRFHGDPLRLVQVVQPAVASAFEQAADRRLLSTLEFATYQREVERYGGPEGIVLAERIFHADSEAVLEFVRGEAGGEARLEERWPFAVWGVHALLADFGLEVHERIALLSTLASHVRSWVPIDAHFESELSSRFRQERQGVDDLLKGGSDWLTARSAALTLMLKDVHLGHGHRQASVALQALAAGYAHMHVNRMLRSEHRAQELLVYEYLSRYYRSQQARESFV